MKQLIENIVYKFHRIGFYLYAIKYDYIDNYKTIGRFKSFYKAIIDNIKIFTKKNEYYEYLEIPITTKCSLKCINCSNLIPYYKCPKDYDINTLRKSIRTFLECIEKIIYIRVLGGEPFLSQNLYPVMKELLKSNKIKRIEIVTNGTIIPKDRKILRLLRNKRIIVSISQYPIVDYEKLIQFLKEQNINYRLDKMKYWYYYGTPTKRDKKKKELIKQYRKCRHICHSLVNGEFHLCPRSSHGTDLKIIKNNEEDYVNLLEEYTNTEKLKEKLSKLRNKKYIKACNYCDYATKNSKKIKVAEQMNLKKQKNI